MQRFLFSLIFLFILPLQVFGTVSIETTKIGYTCNGSTTSHTYPFRVFEDNDIQAIVTSSGGTETTLVLNTDYTVTGAGSVSGGTVVLTAGSKCPSGSKLTILRNIELTQDTDYVDGEAFSAESLENALDKQTLIIQQEKEKNDRALKIPRGSTVSASLPAVVPSGLFAWNALGSAVEFLLTAPAYVSTTVSASSYGTDISAAITAIGSANVTLIVDSPITVNDNAAFHSNTNVVVQSPGLFVVANGKTLTGLKKASPEIFGADPTGAVANFGTALQKAIDSVGTYGVVNIGAGTFHQTEAAVISNSYVTIQGQGESTRITLDADVSCIKTPTDVPGSKYRAITIKDLSILRGATVATTYTIDMYNAILSGLDNVYMVSSSTDSADKTGVRFYSEQAGNVYYENFVVDSFLNNASIVMRTTDGEITNNLIFSNQKEFTLHIGKAQQLITNNEMAGSPIKGCIYIEDIDNPTFGIDLLKISNNLMGASQVEADVHTGWSIYSVSPLIDTSIVGNSFFHESKGAIYLKTPASGSHRGLSITGNHFKNNNKADGGWSDIKLEKTLDTSVSGNTFTRGTPDGTDLARGYVLDTDSSCKRISFGDNTVNTSAYYLAGIYNFQAGSTVVAKGNIPDTGITNVSITPTATLDLSNVWQETVLVGQLAANITTITMPSAPFEGQKLTLRFVQTSTGGPFTVGGWPSTVKLAGGAYTLTATVAKMDTLSFVYTTNGNRWIETSRSQSMAL